MNDFTYGYHLLGKRANSTAINNAGQAGIFSGKDPIEFNSSQPITLFIIQLVIIIVFTQGLGFLFKYIRQPRVIAEVIGGIILGPTVMGRIPNFTNNIFPAPSMPFLNLVATIGLVLFLFVVGMEVDVGVIRKNWKATVSISAAGLILPFGTGAALAVGVYNQFIDRENVDFGHFLLFVGTAISITAFPVLCRILTETKLLTTRVGQIVLSAGVGNDVIGWILLALTIALVNADSGASAAYILICSIAWTIFILWPVRIAFRWLCRRSGCFDGDNGPTPFVMVVMLMLVFISSFMTDIIGVHPIFGGFIVGIIIPHEHSFAQRVTDKLEDLVSVLFLPIYFVLSGLKTNLGLLDNGITWGYSIAIILVAFFGKFIGCAVAAWAMKFSKRESLAVGTLMSCKGLVELIVLNVGLAAGILDARVFSMFVLMAIVNTVVTTPLTLWVYPPQYRFAEKSEARRGSMDYASGAVMGGGSGGSPTIVSRFFVVVSKLEHLGTAMLFTQLFGQTGSVPQAIPASPPTHASDDKSITKEVDTGSETGSDAHHNAARFPTETAAPVEAQRWVAQKLVELTGRTHSVMQSIEAETAATKDDMLQIYKSFAGLRGLNLKTRMDVVDHESFPEVVVNRARDAGSDLVVIPWTTPASGPTAAVLNERRGSASEDEQIAPKSPNPFDHVFGAEKSDLYTFFLRRVFAESGKNIAVLVDRGFAAGKTMSAGVGGQHVFVPFFGGADDRLALSLAVQLCHQSNITATVIRFNQISDIAKPEPAERKRTISSVSMQENIKAHEKALEVNHLTVKKTPARVEAMNSSAADAEAWSNLVDSASSLKHPPALRSAISRIHFQTVPTSEPVSTLIELVNDAVKQHQETSWRPLLALVGRGRLGSSEGNVDGREIARILVNEGHAPDVGAEIRKTIGDVATVLAVTSKASVMVVQSGGEVKEEAA